ncbi:MAG: site-specific DNA-methyltransferase [Phycisphaerales bacterium]|nr:site-specific DNA-methyltransferase [Phycisphaerales bacterium]
MELDTVHAMDARDGLAQLADDSIDCVMTSPPYWSQRRYDTQNTKWSDGWRGALGLEPSFDQYLDHLMEIVDGIWRVLKPTGTFWLNLGDCYAGHWLVGDRVPPSTIKRGQVDAGWYHRSNPRRSFRRRDPIGVPYKSLCMVPERCALRMLARGWKLRSRVVWHKPNPTPSGTRDRLTCSWEYLFLFVKSDRYHFDLDAIRMPYSPVGYEDRPAPVRGSDQSGPRRRFGRNLRGRNPGDVWSIPIGEHRRHGHPAAFPEKLCERPILAGCPPGGIVLDPFAGSGTTCVVAKRLGRRYLGFEASPKYAEQARRRLNSVDSSPPAPQKCGSTLPPGLTGPAREAA